MNGYFRPWRRKIGVVTLLLACACMLTWVGSQDGSHPLLTLNCTRHHKIVVQSFDGHIQLLSQPTNPMVGNGYIKVHAVIPCWPIIFPLTLLSAWLLLSKLRTKPVAATKPTVESGPEKVT